MDGIIPMFEVVTANGGRVLGGFDLACAVQVARQVELGGSLTAVRIGQGVNVVLEGEELRRVLA